MRFVFLVEGRTEKDSLARLLQNWFDARLTPRNAIHVVNMRGNSKLETELEKKVQEQFNQPHGAQTIVVAMLDYLRAGLSYPKDKATIAARCEWAKGELEARINHQRFRAFFAVHEFEAWLLSQPDILPQRIRADLPKSVSHPEQVNDNEPPSRLLNRLYLKHLNRKYRKVDDGRYLFSQLDLAQAARKCPQLQLMLTELLTLASASIVIENPCPPSKNI